MRFEILNAVNDLQHAVTTRVGGVSGGAYESLNLAFHVGDEAEKVRENRRLLASQLGFDPEKLVAAQQVHGVGIAPIGRDEVGRGALDWDSAISNTDALITRERGVPLLILVADCAPILLVDPRQRVLAVVHAGWRGALAGIAGQTVARMASEFGCRAGDVLAGIGPCLCVENLEVGSEVAAQVEAVDALAVIQREEWDKPHLDLRGLIARDLERAGVPEANIEAMPFCSRDDARFFSHRGQNGVAGRFGIVAWWR